MKALVTDIPQRLDTISMPGDLQPVTFIDSLPAVAFSQRLSGIEIPVFPQVMTDDFLTAHGEFLTANGESLTW